MTKNSKEISSNQAEKVAQAMWDYRCDSVRLYLSWDEDKNEWYVQELWGSSQFSDHETERFQVGDSNYSESFSSYIQKYQQEYYDDDDYDEDQDDDFDPDDYADEIVSDFAQDLLFEIEKKYENYLKYDC